MDKDFIFNDFKDKLQGVRYLSSAECHPADKWYLCVRNSEL